MPTTPNPKPTPEQARAARAERVSMLRSRALAGVIATFVLALGTVGFTGSMGQTDSASSGTTSALVDDGGTPSPTTTEDWGDDSSSSADGGALSTGQS